MSTTAVNPTATPNRLTFLERIGNAFHLFGEKVSEIFTKLLGHDAAKKLQDGLVAALKTDAGKVIQAVVSETEETLAGATGPQKHAFALSKVKAQLIQSGHDLAATGTADLDILISGAASLLKDHGIPVTTGAAAAAPATEPEPPAAPAPPVPETPPATPPPAEAPAPVKEEEPVGAPV